MPPKRLSPDDPREWLNRARSNLTKAKVEIPEVYLEDLCFDAQQAAEKAIKAVLLKAEISFPYIRRISGSCIYRRNSGDMGREANQRQD